jgi:hypothetical protein
LEFKLYKNKKGHPLTYLMISPSLLNKTEKELFKKRRWYGSKIEGLTNESKNKLVQEIIPLVIRKVRADILA